MASSFFQICPRVFALTVGAFLCGSCVEEGEPPHLNLLVIAVDTLRADHLGGYGYERPTSPNLDSFFETAVVFEEAHSASSWTLPSFASLMTSVHSSTHGCWQFDSSLDPSFTTLAEALNEAGYQNSAVLSHVFLGSKYGLDQGFHDYDESLVFSLSKSHEAISSPQITEKVLSFLDRCGVEESEQPWFLFAHYFDPHYIYNQHDEVPSEFHEKKRFNRYDGEIAFTDLHIGRVLKRLDELGLAENTVVAFVADHGEEFHDHGGRTHGRTLYREVERIPFAIRVPGLSPRRVQASVSGVDFMPTMLELTGTPAPETPIAGRSLVALMRGGELDERGILLESRLKLHKDADLEAFILGRFKLIVETPKSTDGTPVLDSDPKRMLFDRIADPLEQKDLSQVHPEIVQDLLKELRKAVQEAEGLHADYEQAANISLSKEELDRLRDLGYVGEDSD